MCKILNFTENLIKIIDRHHAIYDPVLDRYNLNGDLESSIVSIIPSSGNLRLSKNMFSSVPEGNIPIIIESLHSDPIPEWPKSDDIIIVNMMYYHHNRIRDQRLHCLVNPVFNGHYKIVGYLGIQGSQVIH